MLRLVQYDSLLKLKYHRICVYENDSYRLSLSEVNM